MEVFLLVIGLLMFVGLVVVHEFGHFIAAKRSNVEVEEFGIGFPPRAKVLTRKNGTIFTLNWLPLGGFVKLKGEHDADTAGGSYGAASLQNKLIIMIAGVAMNLIVAFVLLIILALVGMPKLVPNQYIVKNDTKIVRQDVLVGYIESDSPADKAGLRVRDNMKSIGLVGGSQTIISSAEDFPKQTKIWAGKQITIKYSRQNTEHSVNVQLRSTDEVEASNNTDKPKGYLGLAPTEYALRRSTWSAPIVSVGLIGQFSALTFKGLGSAIANLFRGQTTAASAQVSGPVGIFILLKDGSILGYQFILMVLAIISLTLAIMNILPIPALDGGRIFVTVLFRVFKKKLKENTEDIIHSLGFAALLLLFVLITIVDIKRIF